MREKVLEIMKDLEEKMHSRINIFTEEKQEIK